MIIELRTYSLHPSGYNQYLDAVVEKGLSIRGDRAGRLLGFWVEIAPNPHRVHHLWEHTSFEQREMDRAALLADSAWRNEFLAAALPAVRHQFVRFISPMTGVSQSQGPPEGPTNYFIMRTSSSAPGVSSAATTGFEETDHGKLNRCCGWTTISPNPNETVELFAVRTSDLSEMMKLASARLKVSVLLMRAADFSPMR